MELTAQNVESTLMACLYTTGEDQSQAQEIKAVKFWGKFNPVRVAEQRASILAMLSQLPEQFRSTHIAGGSSFLLACERHDGVHWGEHVHVDYLIALGLAVNAVELLIPREHWGQLAMGVPPFCVKLPSDFLPTLATSPLPEQESAGTQ
jgi:hypothetical protein